MKINKKTMLLVSFALATVLVVGQTGFASESDNNGGMMNMMENGSMNGMMKMMENGNMNKMMEAMNSPEGQEMMNACSKFMESNGDEDNADTDA
jgi:hypothetical protein